MRHIKDAIDIAVSIFMCVTMLYLAVMMMYRIRELYSAPIVQRPLIQGELGLPIPEHEYTAEDMLITLVVNDDYLPDPRKVVFKSAGVSNYTITYDSIWFRDKEIGINKAWNQFFSKVLGRKVTDISLKYNSSNVPTHWEITLA